MTTSDSHRSEYAQLAEKTAELVIWPLTSYSSAGTLIAKFPPLLPGFTATVRIINHWCLQQRKTDIVNELSKLFLNIALTGEPPNWTEISNQLCKDPPPPLEPKNLCHGDVLFAADLIVSLVKLKGKIVGEKNLWDDQYHPSRVLLCDCYKLLSGNPIGHVILGALLLTNKDNCAEVISIAIQYCTAAVLRRPLEEWHNALVAAAPIPVSLVE